MRNNKLKLLIFWAFIAFQGCSQSATSVFNQDPIYAQNIQYTKIAKILENEEVKAIFNLTYLNSVDSSKWDNGKQNFIMGAYYSDDNRSNYKIMMNDQNISKTTIIDKESKLYKNIAFKNNWATYKIIIFDDTEEKTLNLKFISLDNNISTSISFLKE